jgi:hypothetical protein
MQGRGRWGDEETTKSSKQFPLYPNDRKEDVLNLCKYLVYYQYSAERCTN